MEYKQRSTRFFGRSITAKAGALIALILAFILCVPEVSYVPGIPGTVEVEAAVKLNIKKLVIAPGQSYTISVSGSKKDFTWTSANKAVATVKAGSKKYQGVITGVKEGVTTITATLGSKSYECTVVVNAEAEGPEAYGDTLSSTGSFKDITIYECKGDKNTVSRSDKSQKKAKTLTAAKDMKLKNDDYLTVASKGLMRLCMDDEEFVYMASGTEAVVSKGWFSRSKVVLVKGEMIAEVQKHLGEGESLNIVTPNTSMAIRGTVVAVKSTIDKKTKAVTTVNYVLEGKAEVTYTDKKGKTQTVKLKAGEGMKVKSSAKGKTSSKKTADVSAFKFTGIDVTKLKGADGPVSIDTGKTGNGDDTGKTGNGDDTGDTAASEVVYTIGGQLEGKATIPNVTKTDSAVYIGKYWGITGYKSYEEEEGDVGDYPSDYPDWYYMGDKEPIYGWIPYDENGFEGYIFNTDKMGIPVYYVSGDSVDIFTSGSLFYNGRWIKLAADGKGSYKYDATMTRLSAAGSLYDSKVSGTGYARYVDKVDWDSVNGGLGGSEEYMYNAVGNKATLKKGVWLAPGVQGASPFIVVVGNP
jgi:hypothetical protein